MTLEQSAIFALNEFTKTLHALAKLHETQIAVLESEMARVQTHIEGLQARAAQADKRRRKVR